MPELGQRETEQLANFDEQGQGRSDTFYVFAKIRGQVVKVSSNGRVPELTYG